MKHYKTTQTLSLIVILVGVMVILGWVLDIAFLKSILPFGVTMKLNTALAFVISGVLLYCINDYQHQRVNLNEVIIPISSFVLLLIMGTLLLSSIYNVPSIENVLVQEKTSAIETVSPGRPSIGTMFSFLLMGIAGILSVLQISKIKGLLFLTGLIISTAGATAIVGYILKKPLLYYFIANISTAMAVHTAILFTLLGASLMITAKYARGLKA